MDSLLMYILQYGILLAIAAIVSWYFYYYRRRELLGRFIGGMVVAVLGAIIFDLLFTFPFMKVVMEFLTTRTYVHIPAAFLGAYLAVYVLNKINHDQERR